MHRAVVASLLLVAVAQLPSEAAPSRCRHQITDPRGDVDTSPQPAVGDDDAPRLDLVSADLVTTRTTVSAYVKVESLQFEGTNLNQNQYWLRVQGAKGRFTLRAVVSSTDRKAYLSYDGPSASGGLAGLALSTGAGEGVVVQESLKNRFRVTFDRALFDALGGLPESVPVLEASTWRGISAAGVFEISQMDASEQGGTYTAGSAACV